MKNILLVDDHVVIRKGLGSMLKDYYSQLNIFEAGNGDEALHILKQNRIDLVILDLQMPNTDSINVIELISIKYPRSYILVFSILPEKIYARRVLKAGASGFLPKESTGEEMKTAIETAINNEKYLSKNFIEFLSAERKDHSTSPFEALSHREFEIVNLLLTGNSIVAISNFLNIKPSTVGTYKTRIFQKLGVANIFELKEMAVVYEFVSV